MFPGFSGQDTLLFRVFPDFLAATSANSASFRTAWTASAPIPAVGEQSGQGLTPLCPPSFARS